MSPRLALVGCGYVGLTTACGLAERGHGVVAVDIDRERIASLAGGRPPFFEPGLEDQLRAGLASGALRFTGDLDEALAEAELILVAVDTPPGPEGAIDLGQLRAAARAIGTRLRRGQIVVVRSTVVPGTTAGLVQGELRAASRLDAGEFGVAVVPEFLREGSAVADFAGPDRVVVGADDRAVGERVAALFADRDCPILRVGTHDAEMIKYASNTLLATTISFANELAGICEAVEGVDVDRVLDGVSLDRRLSPVVDGRRVEPGILSYLRAGAGFGGSCLPKDLRALDAFASHRGLDTPLLAAAQRINARRPGQVATLLTKLVGALDGRELAVLGLSFKPGTGDTRFSAALRLAHTLADRGAWVRGWDPTVEAGEQGWGRSVASLEQALEGVDGAVIVTAWPELVEADWARLASLMAQPLVLDGRNCLRGRELPDSLRYHPIGRAIE